MATDTTREADAADATDTGRSGLGRLWPSPDDDGEELPLAPTIAAAAVSAAVVLPVLWLAWTALEVGVGPAVALLARPATLSVFLNSTLMVAGVTAASILLGVPLAYLTVRTDLPLARFWTVAVSLPLVVPSYVGAFAFVSAFGTRGIVQRALGVESLPPIRGYWGAVLVITLYTYPYVFITARAALKSMDTRLIDAARTLDHSRWAAFRRVTLPQIRPAVAAGSLLVALYALSDFGTPVIMGFDAFTKVIFTEFGIGTPDFAALLSLQLVAVTLFILWLESSVRGDAPLTAAGQGSHSKRLSLGAWRYPAMAVPAAVAGLALVVPVAILLGWLFAGTSQTSAGLATDLATVLNSVTVAGAAALAATLAGLPIAYLAARRSRRLTAAFERASYVGYAVPGVVLGLALVFFGARHATPIYQTLYLLVFAYVVRFLPQAVGSMRASFLRVDPSLPEAARTLGRSSAGAFREVTMPLIAPGVLGGAALVFLTTMQELPVTLLLKPPGFDTLVLGVWTVFESGHFGRAAVPALVLLGVSGLSMLVILSQEGYDVK